MTATRRPKKAAGRIAEKGETKKKPEPSGPRKRRRRTYQMAAVLAAKETDGLPEPLRSGVVALAQALIRFFQRTWQELTGGCAADPLLRLLPPGNRDPQEDD